MAQQIQLRRDSAADWTTADPTLASGEFGVETDTGKFKIGDGSTAWSALTYFDPNAGGAVDSVDGQTGAVDLSANYDAAGTAAAAVAALVDSSPAALDTLNELAAALGDDAAFSTTVTNALALKAPLASPTFTGTVAGVTKGHVGLGNVDNTSDANKPVSTAGQTALDLKANLASPALTGTPTAPTATPGTNTTQVATTAFVTAASGTYLAYDAGGDASAARPAVAASATVAWFNSPSEPTNLGTYDLWVDSAATGGVRRLAFTDFSGASNEFTNATDTLTRLHAGTLDTAVTFTAPDNGIVVVNGSFIARHSSVAGAFKYGLIETTGGTTVSGSEQTIAEPATANVRFAQNYRRRVTGLTPGASYTWALAQRNGGAGTISTWISTTSNYRIQLEVLTG